MDTQLGQFVIPDDSGIIAVVDANRYDAFIGENWSLDQILERFRKSMSERSLLIWSTGSEGNWRVTAGTARAPSEAFRFCAGTIEVSGEGLHLVSYDSLTMAAQFEGEPIPQPHERENLLALAPGRYTCKVHQLFSPNGDHGLTVSRQISPHFVLLFEPSRNVLPVWEGVQWLVL